MKIKAEKVIGRDLKPGDLFSTAPQEYWNNITYRQSIAEKVYIRTETSADGIEDSEKIIYRITIERDKT